MAVGGRTHLATSYVKDDSPPTSNIGPSAVEKKQTSPFRGSGEGPMKLKGERGLLTGVSSLTIKNK